MSGYRTHDYAKRKEGDTRYSWFSPDYQFIVQQRGRRLLALLQQHGLAALESKTILDVVVAEAQGSGCDNYTTSGGTLSGRRSRSVWLSHENSVAKLFNWFWPMRSKETLICCSTQPLHPRCRRFFNS